MTLTQAQLEPQQMMERLDDFMGKIEEFGNKLGLDLSFAQADHIAMRVNDTALAKAAHEAWASYGETISQAMINGRPIVVIAFDEPLKSRGWSIECLELPYPAEGKVYPSQDWEHVEFVIPSHAQTADEYLADLKDTYPQFAANFETLAEQGVKIKLSSPKGEGERLNNPTVAFKHQGICIKLHPHSLKKIVESEQG
ncbi:VOC family protein [Vibrio sp. Isolate30]|jgi:predicted metalloenzyme YecM|uniref:VOC family protein n=1 Tax=Vibrio sp. Isolate30 TaxID=2908536 RepID=UPI001EFE4B63|nr:VOC family protein [Vibrio sp. Isolate30]MCG9631610.1 VOC family protein [Vibrio sp. Isolate30]